MFTGSASGSAQQLPTFRQWLAEDELRDRDLSATINKIIWSDKFLTITFFTEQFRYTVKANSQEAHIKNCGSILDAFEAQPNNLLHAHCHLTYDSDAGLVEVHLEKFINKEGRCALWKQFDWGLVFSTTGEYTPDIKVKKSHSRR